MAAIDLNELYTQYEGFYAPLARTYLGGVNPEENKKLGVIIADYVVEITSDLKAGIASFSILNAYDIRSGAFRTKDLKKNIALGVDVKILMGHGTSVTEVFKGYIARVDFIYDNDEIDGASIRITAMDVKGIMMANNSSKRLKANYYCDAVKEILDQPFYQALKDNGIIDSITISNTPDKPEGGGAAEGGETPDIRIEMVAESDYDFVVKAAKKFNFEFFTIGGNVAFRKAKSNTQELAEITPSNMVLSYNVGYDITGQVGNVVVRTLDIGKASKIESKKKNTATISIGNKAKPRVSGQSYVYIDSTIETKNDADIRAEYLLEDMAYRLGHITMTLRGMPEFVPGRFIKLKGFGEAISNTYYITDVIHEFNQGGGYITTIEGKASTH